MGQGGSCGVYDTENVLAVVLIDNHITLVTINLEADERRDEHVIGNGERAMF